MQQLSILLNGVKGQLDNIVVVTHTSRKPYDIVSVCFVFLDVESKQRDFLFDVSLINNLVVIGTSYGHPYLQST